MGKRGPRPKPTALRVIEGSIGDFGQRKPNPDEPKPAIDPEIPPPPEFLNARARRHFGKLAPELWATGLLSTLDVGPLAMACEAYAKYEQACLDFEKQGKRDSKTHGVVVETSNGNDTQNILLSTINRLRMECRRLFAEFGMTPSARAAMKGKGSADSDPVADRYFA